MAENHTIFERKTSKVRTDNSTLKNNSHSDKKVKKTNKNIIKKEIRTKLGLSKNHINILKKCKNESTAKELMAILGYTNLTKFRDKYLNILLDEYDESLKDTNKKVIQKKQKDENGNIIMQKIITKKQGYGFFKMSKPDKPNAKDQKYLFTGIFTRIYMSK